MFAAVASNVRRANGRRWIERQRQRRKEEEEQRRHFTIRHRKLKPIVTAHLQAERQRDRVIVSRTLRRMIEPHLVLWEPPPADNLQTRCLIVMGRHLHCLDLESLDMDFVGRLYGVFVHMMPQFLLDPAVLKVFLVRIEQARDQQKARASTSLEHALVPRSRHHQHQRHQQRNQAAGGSAGLQRGTSGGSGSGWGGGGGGGAGVGGGGGGGGGTKQRRGARRRADGAVTLHRSSATNSGNKNVSNRSTTTVTASNRSVVSGRQVFASVGSIGDVDDDAADAAGAVGGQQGREEEGEDAHGANTSGAHPGHARGGAQSSRYAGRNLVDDSSSTSMSGSSSDSNATNSTNNKSTNSSSSSGSKGAGSKTRNSGSASNSATSDVCIIL